MKKIEADNPDEARKKVKDITKEEAIDFIKEELKELIQLPTRDLLSIYGFWNYLKDNHKDKAYMTNKHTPVWKNKETLEKLHKCKILSMENGRHNKNSRTKKKNSSKRIIKGI